MTPLRNLTNYPARLLAEYEAAYGPITDKELAALEETWQ